MRVGTADALDVAVCAAFGVAVGVREEVKVGHRGEQLAALLHLLQLRVPDGGRRQGLVIGASCSPCSQQARKRSEVRGALHPLRERKILLRVAAAAVPPEDQTMAPQQGTEDKEGSEHDKKGDQQVEVRARRVPKVQAVAFHLLAEGWNNTHLWSGLRRVAAAKRASRRAEGTQERIQAAWALG